VPRPTNVPTDPSDQAHPCSFQKLLFGESSCACHSPFRFSLASPTPLPSSPKASAAMHGPVGSYGLNPSSCPLYACTFTLCGVAVSVCMVTKHDVSFPSSPDPPSLTDASIVFAQLPGQSKVLATQSLCYKSTRPYNSAISLFVSVTRTVFADHGVSIGTQQCRFRVLISNPPFAVYCKLGALICIASVSRPVLSGLRGEMGPSERFPMQYVLCGKMGFSSFLICILMFAFIVSRCPQT